jgi:glycosyltransferase involved in cell wall biosynthesis
MPLQVLYFASPRFKSAVSTLVLKLGIDLVHCFMLRLVPYIEVIKKPVVLELIDSMQLNMERRQRTENGLIKFATGIELGRLRQYERMVGERFQRLVVVSAADANVFPAAHVKVIPLGVDATSFTPQRHDGSQTVIFSGNMAYAPNISAITWFMTHCFPLLRRRAPGFRLVIAGANPPRAVRELGRHSGVEVTGYVESLAAALQSSDLAIVPMQSGSGMQFKILEAMACGLPVICTTLGKGDIRATPDDGVICADTPKAFADAIATLLSNPEKIRLLGENARRHVIANYSWEKAVQSIEEIYLNFGARHP